MLNPPSLKKVFLYFSPKCSSITDVTSQTKLMEHIQMQRTKLSNLNPDNNL